MSIASRISLIFIVVILFMTMIFVISRVLFALAVYHDAQAQANPNAVLWGLAVGFLGLVPGIIYLCVRGTGKQYVRCANCGCLHPVTDYCCPQCGQRNSSQAGVFDPVLAAKARKEMIAGIATIVSGLLLTILFTVFFSFLIMRVTGLD